MPWRAASLCGTEGSFAGLTANVPEAEETKKRIPSNDETLSWSADNGLHNSRQVAK